MSYATPLHRHPAALLVANRVASNHVYISFAVNVDLGSTVAGAFGGLLAYGLRQIVSHPLIERHV